MDELPKLRCGHLKQFIRIATKARGTPIPRADASGKPVLGKFIDLISEGGMAYISRPLPTNERRAEMFAAASDARSLAGHLGRLLNSEDALWEEVGFRKPRRGALYAEDTLPPEEFGFAQLHDLEHMLLRLAKHLEKRMPAPKRGPPTKDGQIQVLVLHLAKAWELAVGRPAGTTWYVGRPADTTTWHEPKGFRRGPFVDFVDAVLAWLDPTAPRRKALGDTIYDALADIEIALKGK
jgi:hypothetical protein